MNFTRRETEDLIDLFDKLEKRLDTATYDRVRLKSYITIQNRLVTDAQDGLAELIHEIKDISV